MTIYTDVLAAPVFSDVASHRGFLRMFRPGRLTLGVFFPIEAFAGDRPSMRGQEALARRAEQLGFAALWFRDVPLRDPHFGDVGQIFDVWTYLGYIAAHTAQISLATGAVVLPLRHPLHTAKAAASVDRLSGGRLVLGVASGDRAVEFPAFGVAAERRGELFVENLRVIREALASEFPLISSPYGDLRGADLMPKPVGALPILVTGSSRQSLQRVAEIADGWITYPRPLAAQAALAVTWRDAVAAGAPGTFKPFAQSLYVDLSEQPDEPSTPIHLGFRSGRRHLIAFLSSLQQAGIHHVALNLKYGRRPAGDVLEEIGLEVLPTLAEGEPPQIPAAIPSRG